MRTLFRWLIVTLGIAALVRWLRRRRQTPAQVGPAAPVASEDPADELRRKLAESRADSEDEEPEEVPPSSVEERRADVHAEGRAAVAEMTPSDED